MIQLLRSGQKLSFLIDQYAGSRGYVCDFLGRPASTTTMPALLARRFGAPILPAFALRVGREFRFKLVVGEPILPEHYNHLSGSEAVHEMTLEANRQLEAIVREHPEQWLWLHRVFDLF